MRIGQTHKVEHVK